MLLDDLSPYLATICASVEAALKADDSPDDLCRAAHININGTRCFLLFCAGDDITDMVMNTLRALFKNKMPGFPDSRFVEQEF